MSGLWRWKHLEPVAGVLLVGVALALCSPGTFEPHSFPDSRAYVDWPNDFILRGLKITGPRPPSYPLFLKVFSTGPTLVWAQLLLSLGAWSWLGWVVCRLAGASVGITVALLPSVWRWNVSILTESTSLSMMALCIAASLRMARQPASISLRQLIFFALAVYYFAWARDANLVILPIFALVAFYARGWRRLAAVTVVTSALFIGLVGSRANDRTQWSLDNAIIGWVMTDPDAVQHFERAGMPASENLRAAAGSPSSKTQKKLRSTSPEFFDWTSKYGARVYWTWVLVTPSRYSGAWNAAESFYAADLPIYPRKLLTPQIVTLAGSLAPIGSPPYTLLLVSILMLASVVLKTRTVDTTMAVSAYALSQIAHFITYNGDAAEVHRHMLIGLVLQRVAFFVALYALLSLLRLNARRQLVLHDAVALTQSRHAQK